MFIGHGLLAFAIAATVATRRGWEVDRGLAVGIVAGLFATVPDVDMAYALVGLAGSMEGVVAASDSFWAAAHQVHRAVTHSLVVGTVAAGGFAAWRARDDRRLTGAGATALVGLVAVVGAVGGLLAGTLLAIFVLAGVGVVALAERFGLGARTVLAAALLGLLTHPFGDLLTGEPPAMFYPLDIVLFGERLTLHADPTLHLLGAFFFELATIWLAVLVLARLRGWQLRARVRPRAALGVAYAGAVFAIPAPTLDVASPFVFSVLLVGVVGVPVRSRLRPATLWGAIVTALTAVTVAGFAYTVTYLLVSGTP